MTTATETRTRTYTARFQRASHAEAFAARMVEPGWSATNVTRKGRSRTVTFDGPATAQYLMDMAETVGYFGSPPQGPVATLNGVRTPRSY